MNRHLPFLEPAHMHSDASPPARLHATLPRVSNGTLSNSFPAHTAKKSTIQWVGSQPAASSSSSSDAMAASSFLRCLYESRESVIRSCNSASTATSTNAGNNSGSSGSKGGGVCSEGGAPRNATMYEDMGGTLLTPPGAEVFKDHPPPFSIPSIVISSATSHPSASSPLTTSSSSSAAVPGALSRQLPGYGGQLSRGGCYPPGALSLALPCGGLGDNGYGMTPPSSVSPQDKLPSPFAAAAAAAALAYNESSHGACGLSRPSMHVPASPSSLVAKDAALGCHAGGGGGPGADYASAKAAYYAMSALGGGHSGHGGYADVNHNTTASYDQCARPVIPWY